MPTVQLTIPKNDLNQNQKSKLIEEITESIGDFYIEEKDEQIRDFVNIQIHETAKSGYAVGGNIIGKT